MTEFNTSLQREKFTIIDVMPSSEKAADPVIALSNRLSLPLVTTDGKTAETFVVRAQNMHTCVRMGAQIAREFHEEGPIIKRRKPLDWLAMYLSITKGYEKKWNPNRWVAVYHKGRVIFQDGEAARHPFLDIIEQCDAHSKSNYEKALAVAEDAFKQAGKTVSISHDSNIALVMTITEEEGRCGVILRGPDRTTTFNITARKKAGRPVKISQCLTVAAAYLEGIQLAFLIGMTRQKIFFEFIAESSEQAKQGEDASEKLGRLNAAIAQFENLLDVTYRPDRPNFSEVIDNAMDFAKKQLAIEIERNKDEKGGKWVV